MEKDSANPHGLTSDDLYHILREEILSLALEPGSLLSENQVSKRFNVSRTPIRSAFERLRQDQFLEIVPRKGTYIRPIDLDMAEQIIYMRIQVERGAMEYLAQHPNPLLFEKMEYILAQQKAQIGMNSVVEKEFYRTDSQFHELCMIAIDKYKLWQHIQHMDVHYSRYRYMDYRTTQKFSILYREHQKLLQHMKEGRADLIAGTLTAHLYGGILRIGTRFSTQFENYLADTERSPEEIFRSVKKSVNEALRIARSE